MVETYCSLYYSTCLMLTRQGPRQPSPPKASSGHLRPASRILQKTSPLPTGQGGRQALMQAHGNLKSMCAKLAVGPTKMQACPVHRVPFSVLCLRKDQSSCRGRICQQTSPICCNSTFPSSRLIRRGIDLRTRPQPGQEELNGEGDVLWALVIPLGLQG